MQIRDFSLPTCYAALPASYGCEERTAHFLEAVHQGNWCEALDLLEGGLIDPIERDKVLLYAAGSESEALALDLVRIARSHGPLPARVDSQILLSAAERGLINLVSEQLDNGLIQPWAADASLKAAAERTYPDITYLLLQTDFCSKKWKEEVMALRCSHSFPRHPSFPGTCYGSPEKQLAMDLSNAYNWTQVYDLFQKGPIPSHPRDPVLCDAIRFLREPDSLLLLNEAHKHNKLPAKIDSQILWDAAKRGFAKLVKAQLQTDNIEPWSVDAALKDAAANDHADIVGLLLETKLYSQKGIHQAALNTIENQAMKSLLEMITRGAIEGNYSHPMNSFLDSMLGTPLEESIWTVLLREAGRSGYLGMAEIISRGVEKLSDEELGYLAIAATLARQEEVLEKVLTWGPIQRCLRDEAIKNAERNGYRELIPILEKAKVSN